VNKKTFYILTTLFAIVLLSWVNNISIHTRESLPTQNKLQASYHQLPQTTNGLAYFIGEFEVDDDSEDKFQKDLVYNYIAFFSRLNNSEQTQNHFLPCSVTTNLYAGVPIYSAIGNYRI